METKDKLKVFLVDDDYSFTHYIKKSILKSHTGKVEISTYCTGEDCLVDLDVQPDLIILDYHLNSSDKQAMNGMEILKRIKQNLPDVKVLFVSSQKKPEVMMDTFRYGAEDYISKTEKPGNKVCEWTNYLIKSMEVKKMAEHTKQYTAALSVALVIGIVVMFFLSML